MELESGSFSIDVDNTPTRVNYPPLGEYNHCLMKKSNFKIINEGMIPRVLPEPRAVDANGVQLLQNTTTNTTANVNLICSSPLLSRLDLNSKRSSPMVYALPDDFTKSNEVFRQVYGSSSFTESSFIRRNSSVRSKLNQDCTNEDCSEYINGLIPMVNTSAKRSNASSVMSIELIMNPASPRKEEHHENEHFGVTLKLKLIGNLIYGKESDIYWGDDGYDEINEYDQFIVTIKLPSKLEGGNVDNFQSVAASSKKSSKRRTTSKRRKRQTLSSPKYRGARVSKRKLKEQNSPRSNKGPRGKRAKENMSDQEYLPTEEPMKSKSKTRVKSNSGAVSNKKPIVRSRKGCWTCRVRHKRCTEEQPQCANCKRLKLVCDYSEIRPDYMIDLNLQAEKLIEIRKITDKIKRHGKK